MAYRGTLDEDKVSGLITQFGELLEESGDLGFVLTYHASRDGGAVMDLAGKGISQELFETLLADALAHNAEYGSTL